jgi:hypothetical protein
MFVEHDIEASHVRHVIYRRHVEAIRVEAQAISSRHGQHYYLCGFDMVETLTVSKHLIRTADPAETSYGGAVDVERAADLYAQGWTLRQIGAELGVHWSTISQQLQPAGTMTRSGGAPAHPTSTHKILELRDQGLTWNA